MRPGSDPETAKTGRLQFRARVRPASSSSEPEATDERYCRWDRLVPGHGYTKAWVDKLDVELSDASTYEIVVGLPPELI